MMSATPHPLIGPAFYGAGRISHMLKLYLSAVGAVSLIVTVVPLKGVVALCICTQYVSPLEAKS